MENMPCNLYSYLNIILAVKIALFHAERKYFQNDSSCFLLVYFFYAYRGNERDRLVNGGQYGSIREADGHVPVLYKKYKQCNKVFKLE